MSVIWYYRHGCVYADEVEPDRDWQSAFFWMDDSDECAVDGVELDDGTWIPVEQARRDPEVVRMEREQYERYRQQSAQARQYRTIMMLHPERKEWAAIDTVASGEAKARLDELAARYGSNRVKLHT